MLFPRLFQSDTENALSGIPSSASGTTFVAEALFDMNTLAESPPTVPPGTLTDMPVAEISVGVAGLNVVEDSTTSAPPSILTVTAILARTRSKLFFRI